MDTTMSVKDFVIDVPETIKEFKTKKERARPKGEYKVVLQNNIDFVVNRITNTTDKNLVFLISQGNFYIKDNKTGKVEPLNKQKIQLFFDYVSTKNSVVF